jgi:hypothetical protein
MNIDERIAQLAVNQERTQTRLAPMAERLGRLERIAVSREVRPESVEETLARLERKRRLPK